MGRAGRGCPAGGSRRVAGAGLFLLALILGAAASSPLGAQPGPEEIEFFEKKIRPVLAEECYICHSAETTAMGELRLDSGPGLRKGGSRGAAIVPGDPAGSLLIKAISYKDLDLKMPPSGKLSDEQIADLSAWIEMGAPDPREDAVAPAETETPGIDFAQGRKFWAFQAVREPAVPSVNHGDWPASPIDFFTLAKLEQKGLSPGPPADKRTWLRRVTFDLIGLPPSPTEIEDFLADTSPKAYEAAVERLLSSPHYGERWGRHWLDLVRFAETNGHEYDNNKLDAWRYRDYVIRAFNQDLPYSRFVTEHIAGDLLADPRAVGDGTRLDSPVGTGFYWLWEVLNSATDSVKFRADEVDNQIDVIGKTFLGMTVACARCHDHKFDPIPTADYYSLAGILHSTDLSERCIDSPARTREIEAVRKKIADRNQRIGELLPPARENLANDLKGYLLAAVEFARLTDPESRPNVAEWAEARRVDGSLLEAWAQYLDYARSEPDQVLHPFAVLAAEPGEGEATGFGERVAALRRELLRWNEEGLARAAEERGDIVFEDFESEVFEDWTAEGQAFGERPSRSLPSNLAVAGYKGQGLANSFGEGSDELTGILTSKKFIYPSDKLYAHIRLAGTKDDRKLSENAKTRLTLVADAHKSLHLVPDGSGRLEWQRMVVTKERKRTCYFEIVDRSREGHIVVDKIVFSDSEEPPRASRSPNPKVLALLDAGKVSSLEGLAAAYQGLFEDALDQPEPDAATRNLLAALPPTGKFEDLARWLPGPEQARLRQMQQERAALEAELPESSFGMTSLDRDPRDVRVHIRGNHKNLGEPVPRQFLQIIAGEDQEPFTRGSGRLELAEWMASPDNPLTARVMVNRIWKHHFGQGIVRSADNFGQTGERPTHPELLDHLARRFVENNWSVKSIHRMIVLSSTYRMSSRASAEASAVDPQNKLLSHMSVRRLEAEAIRDSLLAVAGTLDPTVYGPSVPPHISEYQDGRGKPESGPLDGKGRRSVYVQVRRNFLPPMFLAFDYPLPISTIGRRSVSAVPSQALILLNNEFVNQQAGKWAQREIEAHGDERERIEDMFVRAFGRPPESAEASEILEFLEQQRQRYEGAQRDDPRLWADLAHVLMNTTEFIYVR